VVHEVLNAHTIHTGGNVAAAAMRSEQCDEKSRGALWSRPSPSRFASVVRIVAVVVVAQLQLQLRDVAKRVFAESLTNQLSIDNQIVGGVVTTGVPAKGTSATLV
jgi:hypothetical protein